MNRNKRTLVFGFGGAGCRLAYLYSQEYKSEYLLFNTAETDIENEDVILLKDNEGNALGSGRNPLKILNEICPLNHDLIEKYIKDKINKGIDKIITFSSSGGGSGSALLSYIVEKILSKYTKSIYSIIILPFKSEGNPQNSNSVIMIKKFMEKCSKYITPLLLQNDIIYVEGEKNTFDLTNRSITEFTYKVFNYKAFNGAIKKNGISTLDENEFNRMLESANGFLSVNIIKIEDLRETEISEFYDLNSAKKMIILFQSNKNIPLKEKIDYMHKLYPSPVKIIAESKGKNIIKIISNGCDLPTFYKEDINNILKNIKLNKIKIKNSKNKFKNETKKLNNNLLKL